MIANCYQIDDTLQLKPIVQEEAVEACQRNDERIWIDLHDFEFEELEAWLDNLKVKDLSRRLCLEALDRSGFHPLKDEIFLVVRILADAHKEDEGDHIAFLCRENLLLTLHQKPISRLEELAIKQASEDWLSERSIGAFVFALMIALSVECIENASELRASFVELQERMEQEPDTVQVEEILEMRTKYLALDRVVSDQLPCVHALSRTDLPFFKQKNSKNYINCALANLETVDKAADRLDKRIIALRSAFQMNAQDKTNRRLGILTILSAIFLPLTFMAGIWGMNFESMPELKFSFAYPVVLGIMIIVALSMYLYFKKSGWFD